MRINKLLSNKGICSRKDAARMIEEGRIIVNGEQCIPGQWVEESDEILIDNEAIHDREKVYIAFNKPVGITCTAEKTVHNNIIDYINYGSYIFPIGRLDKESQGLIILTNDGDLANAILDSDNYHEKEYVVTVTEKYDDDFIEKMRSGVDINCGVTRKCSVTRIDDFSFNIVLTQGMNRQIRRMCRALGYTVDKLKRIRILNIKLDGIEEGKWRYIIESEVSELRKLAEDKKEIQNLDFEV